MYSSIASRRLGDPNGEVGGGGRVVRTRGVLLVNLGTPDSPEVPDVRRYLAEFLSDPEVITLPRTLSWLNGALGRMIARFRAPKSAEMYRKIWTDRGSPLLTITQDQALALEEILPDGWRVFYAMRYGRPSIQQTVRSIEAAGVDELVVIPMYPQFSGPTTGTALRELYSYLRRSECDISVTTRAIWCDDGGYVNAQAKLIYDFASAEGLAPEDTYLLFSAHGLPVSYVERGDPYPQHVRRTIDLVTQRLGWPADRCGVAYQSRFGPTTWLEPATNDVLSELCDRGEKKILVCAISFTTDCLETLEEIDVRYRSTVAEKGAALHLCPSLNTYEPFVAAVRDLVLRGPSPIASWGEETPPLMAPRPTGSADAGVDSLVLIGTSLPARLGSGAGPELDHADADGLRRVKLSQCEVPALLRSVHDVSGISESLLWNTCNRFEFCGWLDDPNDESGRQAAVDKAREKLFGGDPAGDVPVNVLYGAEAWHHVLRTAVGLNSKLPGERDIVDQLGAAHRLAKCAGTTGPLANRMLADVQSAVGNVREETGWGAFDPDYCQAALSGVATAANVALDSCSVVVIGGSTTSAGVLRALIAQFDVSSRQLTLLYRGHSQGGQVKLLRKAIGQGKRVRLQSYDEPQVVRAVADADVVVFGLDREDPVLTSEQLVGLRDFSERPLTVVDFNMFGSTSGLDGVDGVELFTAGRLESLVDAYAAEMCSTDQFSDAVEAVERWIEQRVHGNAPDAADSAELVGAGAARAALAEEAR